MALDEVTQRLERITGALDKAQVPHALVGGQAVRALGGDQRSRRCAHNKRRGYPSSPRRPAPCACCRRFRCA